MRWLVGLLLVAWFGVADARPGGGHSYSGGSYRSSGGSYRSSGGSYRSSGNGEDVAVVGIVLFAFVVALLVTSATRASTRTSWTSATARPASRIDLQRILDKDPRFSQVVFEDFAFELFAAAQRARGERARLLPLTPYLDVPVIEQLATSPPVQAVVIGSLRIVAVAVTASQQQLDVRVEANLVAAGGAVNVVERWRFVRAHEATTRVAGRMDVVRCPSCNAPFTHGSDPRACAHCGAQMTAGRFDWTCVQREVGAVAVVGTTLTGTVAEVGTDLPTQVDAQAHLAAHHLWQSDPGVTWGAFEARARMIYERLNAAWNARDLGPVRGLTTTSLHGYLQFWIDEYARQRLANRLDAATVHRVQLAKVVRDPYFDAITVRLWADGADYTINASGEVVGGSRSERRRYSEYWTFVRSASRRGPIQVEPRCPNCGAPLAISDSGACTHCNAVVEGGGFDWVLSKIEQDEVYTG